MKMNFPKNLQEKVRSFEEKNDCTVLYLTEYGSRLYGTNNEFSDTDYKGVFVQSKEKLLLQQGLEHFTFNSNNSNTKNSSDDVDLQLFSVHKFFQLVKKGETGALDILFSMFSPSVVYENTKFTDLVKNNYKSFLNKNLNSFTGYAVGQASKYGVKGSRFKELLDFNLYFSSFTTHADDKLGLMFNTFKEYFTLNKTKYLRTVFAPGPKTGKGENLLEYVEVLGKKFSQDVTCSYFFENLKLQESQFGNRTKSATEGTDFKSLSHACRVLLEVEELLVHQKVTFPLLEKDFVYLVKQGSVPLEEVQNFVDSKLDTVKTLMETTDLPETSDLKLMDTLELQVLDLR